MRISKFTVMKRCLFVLLVAAFTFSVSAQTENIYAFANIDSLKHEVEITNNDTMRYVLLDVLARAYQETKPDSSYYYSKKSLEVARKLKIKLAEAATLGKIGYALQNMGNYPASLKAYLSAI